MPNRFIISDLCPRLSALEDVCQIYLPTLLVLCALSKAAVYFCYIRWCVFISWAVEQQSEIEFCHSKAISPWKRGRMGRDRKVQAFM